MMIGILSPISAVIGYIEGRLNSLFENIIAKLVIVGVLDAVLTYLLASFKSIGLLAVLSILVLIVGVIEYVANPKNATNVITTLAFVVILMFLISNFVKIPPFFILKNVEMSAIIVIPLADILYGMIGYSIASLTKISGYE